MKRLEKLRDEQGIQYADRNIRTRDYQAYKAGFDAATKELERELGDVKVNCMKYRDRCEELMRVIEIQRDALEEVWDKSVARADFVRGAFELITKTALDAADAILNGEKDE